MTVELSGGATRFAAVELPAGAPGRPLDPVELEAKVRDCAGPDAAELLAAKWGSPPSWVGGSEP